MRTELWLLAGSELDCFFFKFISEKRSICFQKQVQGLPEATVNPSDQALVLSACPGHRKQQLIAGFDFPT